MYTMNKLQKELQRAGFKGISLKSKFTVHGHYTVSNWGGYEIMLSRDGESARVRDAYGSKFPKTSRWLKIEYMPDADDGMDLVIDPEGYNIPLGLVMSV
jgi:hypothetical protein